MRFRDDRAKASSLALGIALALAACAGKSPELAGRAGPAPVGPAADYPVVLGEPYTVEGTLYSPADTLNYDQVGLAIVEENGAANISVAHRTLPLPSYVEITALDSGKTILARVERRGPMHGNAIAALSQGAADQLEFVGGGIRLRRVNPQEWERAKLRAGERAPERIETPEGLLAALRMKMTEIPDNIVIMLPSSVERVDVAEAISARDEQTQYATVATVFADVAQPRSPELPTFEQAQAPVSPPKIEPKPTAVGDFVVQAGAFSSMASATRVAEKIGGQVSQSGKFFRVRTGPFGSRGEAQAALAKVKAAGYTDARIYRK